MASDFLPYVLSYIYFIYPFILIMRKSVFSTTILSLVIGLFIFSCSTDDVSIAPTSDIPKIDVTDPDALSAELKVRGTLKTGTPPAPSTDAAAPEMFVNSEGDGKLTVTGGSSTAIPLNFSANGDGIAGAYFKVKGAEDYYDIPLEGLTNEGRIGGRLGRGAKTEVDVYRITIGFPENIAAGTFCAEYCIYDHKGRVSNVLEVCIEVLEFGGTNSGFLTANTWSMVYTKYTETDANGGTIIDYDSVGVLSVDEDHILSCDNSNTPTTVFPHYYKTNYAYMTFAENGAYGLTAEDYSKSVDSTYCSPEPGATFKEEIEIYDEKGVWSYVDSESIVTIVYQDDNGGSYFERFEVATNGELLNLTYIPVNEDDEDKFEIVFKKK